MSDLDYLIRSYTEKRTIIFDLDDTLYLERNYLFIAYEEISVRYYPDVSENVFHFLCNKFSKYGRDNLYQKLINEFGRNLGLNQFLECLRCTHIHHKIDVLPWFGKFCCHTDKQICGNIITNGSVKQQINKIESICWPENFKLVNLIYANKYEPKPSVASFRILANKIELFQPIYVGDSAIDKKFAQNTNMEFFNVNTIKDTR